MLRKTLRWTWSHRKTSLGLFLLLALLLLNLLAYLHAHAMTHYAPAGTATNQPETLSALEKLKVLCTGVTVPRPSAGDRSPADVGLPFEVHRIAGEGVALEAWYVPHAQVRGLVLMFHGYAACKAGLLREARALHELGYALLLVDFRGSGGSSDRVTTIGVVEAEDVALAVAYARAHWGGQPLVLFGQSMGGAAVLRALAVQRVQARAVVLECPFDRLANTVANRFAMMGLPAFPLAQFLVLWGGVQHGYDGFAHNPVEYARSVDCPVLLLQGAKDQRVRPHEAEAIFQSLRGPKALEVFAEAGHESLVGHQPEQWRRFVAEFLLRHAPASSAPAAGIRP
jgi:alpha-beta hydrolase superfamily lysophospholipase